MTLYAACIRNQCARSGCRGEGEAARVHTAGRKVVDPSGLETLRLGEAAEKLLYEHKPQLLTRSKLRGVDAARIAERLGERTDALLHTPVARVCHQAERGLAGEAPFRACPRSGQEVSERIAPGMLGDAFETPLRRRVIGMSRSGSRT